MEQFCEYCNEPFIPKRSDALYCSPGCRQLAYVLRKAQSNPVFKELNYPSTRIAFENELMDEEQEASTQIIQTENNPSKREEQDLISVNKIIVNTDNKESNEQSIEDTVVYSSVFIRELQTLIDKRDNIDYFMEDTDMVCEWVNLRYRCLVESLLTVSEMRTVELDDLKEICNAFTSMIQSSDYESLPDYYPYAKDITTLWQSLKKICLEAVEDQTLNFKLKRSTRLCLLATRWELAHFVRKESFDQLDFEE